MKKNLLALSIAAMVGGLSGVANAQAVVTDTVGERLLDIRNAQALVTAGIVKTAPSTLAAPTSVPAAATKLSQATTGVGHILLVPYFSTQGSHATLLNLVNTDQVNGKAVKLRFRGAANSDDLFDITIFLSPGDVWAANVSASGELSALSTNDTSCTLPSAAQLKEGDNSKFSVRRVMDNKAEQTREGYVEILNMADVVPGTDLFKAIKHVNGVAPCTETVMRDQLRPLSTVVAADFPAARGYSWPTGGLMANWTLVDVGTKASFTGEAVALRATPNGNADAAGAANIVFSPQTAEVLDPAVIGRLTADPLLLGRHVLAANYDFPDLSTPYTAGALAAVNPTAAQAEELSDALATFSVNNEYLTNPAVNFATDWVFSMPSRRYAVAVNYGADNKTAALVSNPAVVKYFNKDINVSLNNASKLLCVKAGPTGLNNALVPFDHEERTSSTSFVVSPGAPQELIFCGETSVLTFNGKASVLGASLVKQNINTGFTDGWLHVKTPGLGNGLPVVGYAVGKAIGPDGGNFGGTWMHRTNKVAGQPF